MNVNLTSSNLASFQQTQINMDLINEYTKMLLFFFLISMERFKINSIYFIKIIIFYYYIKTTPSFSFVWVNEPTKDIIIQVK